MVNYRVGLIDETRLGIVLVKSANYESVRGYLGFRILKYKNDLLLTSSYLLRIIFRKFSFSHLHCRRKDIKFPVFNLLHLPFTSISLCIVIVKEILFCRLFFMK